MNDDDLFNGAAALTFYLLLSLFPAVIFLLSLLPYLPVENLDQQLMKFIGEVLPTEAARMFSKIIIEVTSYQNTKLISFGIIATLWAASNGMFQIMKQINRTFQIKDDRPFWKGRSVSILMTFIFGLLIIGAFLLLLFGDFIKGYAFGFLNAHFDVGLFFNLFFNSFFEILRWSVVIFFMLLGFAVIYYFGLQLKQKFQIFSFGSVVSVSLLVLATLGFRYYIENFSNYSATYGSIGAVIVLMLWLYILGIVIIFGSEINALIRRRLAQMY